MQSLYIKYLQFVDLDLEGKRVHVLMMVDRILVAYGSYKQKCYVLVGCDNQIISFLLERIFYCLYFYFSYSIMNVFGVGDMLIPLLGHLVSIVDIFFPGFSVLNATVQQLLLNNMNGYVRLLCILVVFAIFACYVY